MLLPIEAPHQARSLPNKRQAKKKHSTYDEAVKARRGRFIPFIVSVDGMLETEALEVVRGISRRLAAKWHRPYSEVACWVWTRLSFAILRAANQCVRSSRVRWRGLGTDDGVALASMMS
eukprot:GHVN01044013.1.p1 GENE.GHVN01044013.1~~GHVN01044013.1.p1  ORF type:complete len:119 (-),score=14.29 GHVN01044013.1:160-516(-)